ncbi:hypothetical protein J2S44_006634 [Catenuloplanes niger]|uniref:Uncharacterized protein n=1 Tax=Catenuloplanes niger TaxID=587534 RepID=A0AAE4CYY8_9ACTN|nr:hypothetical protein [Catenuloplanes niger]
MTSAEGLRTLDTAAYDSRPGSPSVAALPARPPARGVARKPGTNPDPGIPAPGVVRPARSRGQTARCPPTPLALRSGRRDGAGPAVGHHDPRRPPPRTSRPRGGIPTTPHPHRHPHPPTPAPPPAPPRRWHRPGDDVAQRWRRLPATASASGDGVGFRLQRRLPATASASGYSVGFRLQRRLPATASASGDGVGFRLQRRLPATASASGYSVGFRRRLPATASPSGDGVAFRRRRRLPASACGHGYSTKCRKYELIPDRLREAAPRPRLRYSPVSGEMIIDRYNPAVFSAG